MIEQIKNSLPLEAVMKDAGIVFSRGKALCVFHTDKTPSLSIKNDRFKCWSCGEGGDIIDFTEKYHGLSKGDAIKYLAGRAGFAIDRSRPVQVDREAERSRELVRAFRDWESSYHAELADFYRIFTEFQTTFKTMEEAKEWALLTHEMPKIEYRMDILIHGTDQDKFELYKAVKNER